MFARESFTAPLRPVSASTSRLPPVMYASMIPGDEFGGSCRFLASMLLLSVGTTRELFWMLQVGDETGLCWVPSQAILCFRARGRRVAADEECKPAEMLGCLLGGFGDDRHVGASADCFGDLSKRHALFGDGVNPFSRNALFKGQPVEPRSIDQVRRGPAVAPIVDVRRDSLCASQLDQVGDEALLVPVGG